MYSVLKQIENNVQYKHEVRYWSGMLPCKPVHWLNLIFRFIKHENEQFYRPPIAKKVSSIVLRFQRIQKYDIIKIE